MFTGIIEEVGTVKGFAINGSSGRIKIKAKKVLEGTKLGDSIAVNGVCLTVVTASILSAPCLWVEDLVVISFPGISTEQEHSFLKKEWKIQLS